MRVLAAVIVFVVLAASCDGRGNGGDVASGEAPTDPAVTTVPTTPPVTSAGSAATAPTAVPAPGSSASPIPTPAPPPATPPPDPSPTPPATPAPTAPATLPSCAQTGADGPVAIRDIRIETLGVDGEMVRFVVTTDDAVFLYAVRSRTLHRVDSTGLVGAGITAGPEDWREWSLRAYENAVFIARGATTIDVDNLAVLGGSRITANGQGNPGRSRAPDRHLR